MVVKAGTVRRAQTAEHTTGIFFPFLPCAGFPTVVIMAPTSLSETVEDLMDSLDTLEDVLAPVLDAGPLSSTLEKLDVLERAKLQATLTYVTQDLVFSMEILL